MIISSKKISIVLTALAFASSSPLMARSEQTVDLVDLRGLFSKIVVAGDTMDQASTMAPLLDDLQLRMSATPDKFKKVALRLTPLRWGEREAGKNLATASRQLASATNARIRQEVFYRAWQILIQASETNAQRAILTKKVRLQKRLVKYYESNPRQISASPNAYVDLLTDLGRAELEIKDLTAREGSLEVEFKQTFASEPNISSIRFSGIAALDQVVAQIDRNSSASKPKPEIATQLLELKAAQYGLEVTEFDRGRWLDFVEVGTSQFDQNSGSNSVSSSVSNWGKTGIEFSVGLRMPYLTNIKSMKTHTNRRSLEARRRGIRQEKLILAKKERMLRDRLAAIGERLDPKATRKSKRILERIIQSGVSAAAITNAEIAYLDLMHAQNALKTEAYVAALDLARIHGILDPSGFPFLARKG